MSQLSLIKELREKTGAGFLDCKNALVQNNNDIDSSIDSLRKKGLAKATKKSSREAKDGAIGFFYNENISILLKINSETDFCAKSDTFLDFVDILGNAALNLNDPMLTLEKFLDSSHDNKKISELLTEMIAKIGENIILNQIEVIENKELFVSHYVHNPYRANIGKIISCIFYSIDKKDNEIEVFSKNLCMHIAALKPEAMNVDQLPLKVIENEKKIQSEMIKDSGKPTNVVEKILDGKMKKFYSEVTLLNQNFVIDPDKTISKVIEDFKSSNNFSLIKFSLMVL